MMVPELDQAEVDEPAEQADQGRVDARPSTTTKTRKRRPAAASEKTSKRGLHLRDDLWERLQLEAIRKRTTVSAIANDLLDRNLARLRIERDA